MGPPTSMATVTVAIAGLQRVIDLLVADGYEVLGPVVRDGAIVVRPLASVGQLPLGSTTVARPGQVDLVDRADRARFGWALPAQSWKPYVHPARVRTMTMHRSADGAAVSVAVTGRRARRRAFIGMRPCELVALERLDTVLLDRPPTPEPTYANARADTFLIVVNCGSPADTCFCPSMDAGPHVDGRSTAHDLEITELVGRTGARAIDRASAEAIGAAGHPGDPIYTVRAISDRAQVIVERLLDDDLATPATADDDAEVDRVRAAATEVITRQLDAPTVAQGLPEVHDAAAWDDVAATCLACGNCTAVCPTCFCTTIDDVGDLTGRHVERWRTWESCFSLEFSRLGSHPVRASLASRYRQWMTHKLSTWHDQFGESGCVGCGRCTAWCPAGIDFVAVATALVGAHDTRDPQRGEAS